MKKKILISLLPILILNFVYLVAAEQPTKVARIGFLIAASRSAILARTEAFQQGLRELGYVEEKNIVIEWRSSEGQLDRLPALAAELVHLKVDVIVTTGSGVTRAAKEATVKIPIVMTQDNDPIGNGFVASLARPGGNITGLAILAPEISGKQVELLNETVPRFSRLAALGTLSSPGVAQASKEVELAAAAFRVKLQYLDVRDSKDVETAFRAASKGRADAVLVLPGAVLNSQRKQIADLAIKRRLPGIFPFREYVEAGGLMSYSAHFADLYRRAATHVDKILKGAKPTDLPVEQPTKFAFIINLKTAKQIGLTIPQSVLYRVDEVIK
jgi:putative tryptophan/tyrosine transport system substrate-binding protein